MLFHAIHARHDCSPLSLADTLGGKGAGLALMASELGLPVPPGFTLTTEACRRYREHGWSSELEETLRRAVAGLEAESGRRFGAETRPLLVSVRSGAPESMPGMLDTILDVGLDAKALRGLEREIGSAAGDCRAVLAAGFRASLGRAPDEDPWDQLRSAVEAVFRSTGSRRALAYRRRQGLANDERDGVTAVTVQAMVFGNRDADSATGVVFSRNPATGEAQLYGDLLFRAQGEEVVAGRRATQPIDALDARLPAIAGELRAAVSRLEERLRDLCEIEFTIEDARLWLLQVRIGQRTPRAALRIARDLAQDPDFPIDRREAVGRVASLLVDPPRDVRLSAADSDRLPEVVARGLGASPGVASGRLAIDLAGIERLHAAGEPALLVRPETSPEDVEAMSFARGLVTARGGLASHAAVIARGWGVPAVVGVESLALQTEGIVLGGRRFAVGDWLSLDGAAGTIYDGPVETRSTIAREAETLLDWARELGIPLDARDSDQNERGDSKRSTHGRAKAGLDTAATLAAAPPTSAPARVVDDVATDDRLLDLLEIKGFATAPQLASALAVSEAEVLAAVDRLVASDLAQSVRAPLLGLTEAGRARAAERLAEDRARWGADRAAHALASFQALDERAKRAVTDWQLRPVGDALVANDHADPDWDEAVFHALGGLVVDVAAWLEAPARRLPRLARYALRLDRALAAARAGNAQFIASPRVDSFHGIWFELHEDLIRLAGSSRAEEVAAGRAG